MLNMSESREIAIAACKQESEQSAEASGREAVFRNAAEILEQDWTRLAYLGGLLGCIDEGDEKSRIHWLYNRITSLENEVEKLRSLLYEWLGQQASGDALAEDTKAALS